MTDSVTWNRILTDQKWVLLKMLIIRFQTQSCLKLPAWIFPWRSPSTTLFFYLERGFLVKLFLLFVKSINSTLLWWKILQCDRASFYFYPAYINRNYSVITKWRQNNQFYFEWCNRYYWMSLGYDCFWKLSSSLQAYCWHSCNFRQKILKSFDIL